MLTEIASITEWAVLLILAVNLPNQPSGITQTGSSQMPAVLSQPTIQPQSSSLNNVGRPYSVSGQVPMDKTMEQQQNMKCGGPAKFIRRGH